MTKFGIAAAALVYAGSVGAAFAANLSVGIYSVSSLYLSAKPSGGGTCIFPANTSLLSVYTYPGANKAGATSRSFVNSSTAGEFVSLTAFPTTPAAGANTWSGNVTATFLPGGAPSTGTFSSDFTVTDSKSYVATTTYIYPSGTGSCTSVVQEVGIWTAK